jgi:hypothetical protein
MWQGVDFDILCSVFGYPAQARQCVDTINVHGTRAADTLSARPTEGESWVHFVLDLDYSIKNL